MKPKIKYFFLLSMILFCIQPFLTWFNADDYCLIPKLKAHGVFQCMYDDYLNWDGRSVSVAYLISRLGLMFELYWLGPMLGTIMLMLSAFFIVKAQTNERLISTSFNVLILIWLGSFYFISQTLYWTTGVGYTFEMFILILAGYFLREEDRSSIVFKIVVFFIIGGFSPNAVIAILVVITIDALRLLTLQKKKVIPLLIYAFLVLTGLLVVTLAPGNRNRLPGEVAIRDNLLNPYQIYANMKWLFESLFNFNTPISWILILIGILGAIIQSNDLVKTQHILLKKIVNYFSVYKWLVAAGISVFAFLPFPGYYAYSPRINIHFFTFIILFASMHFKSFYQNVNNLFFYYTTFIIRIVFLLVIFTQSYDAYIAKGMMTQRINFLKSQRGKSVILEKELMINTPTSRRFQDIETDSSSWINVCACEYFELKSIKRTP